MPSSSAYIPSFSISNFAQSVSAPYTSFGAYASGVIDANGNLLKPESSIDPFEYFVIKLKKIFEELPTNYTKARLNSYMSTFQIFNEEAEFFGIPKNHFLMFVEGYLQGGLLLNEDMGAGMATGGSPGSLGTAQVVPNTGTVMGYDKPMDSPLFRRSPVEMFDVDHNEFQNFKNAKAWKHIPDSPTKKYLKRFQQRNPTGKMAIRTKKPDTDEHDLYWITYPAKNFMEEFGLDMTDFLFEEKVGKSNLKKSGDSQYKGIAHFLHNHINVGHSPKEFDFISIRQNSTGNVINTNIKDFRKTMADMLISHHEKDHEVDSFQITTPKGIMDIHAPHVSSKNPNDLTIKDFGNKKEITVDMKGGRGRWQFQDEIDTPKKAGRVSSKEFKKIAKGSSSFVAFHDQSGNIEHIDTSDLANTRKMVSSFYYKQGSSRRPGNFILPGEVNVSLTDTGKKKAAKRNVTKGENMVSKSAQQHFPQTMKNITGTEFGKNDMYTSMLRKKAL